VKVKDFVFVAKPGIVFGNVFAGVGGFFIGSPDSVNRPALFGLITGMTAIIAASCVVNNYLDADIDARMKRTAKRPSVTGAVPVRIGRIYAAALYLAGFSLLFGLTNLKTALIGLFGAVMYTVVYGYAKRHTPWATLIGAFPGATPPLAGYVAATGRFDEAAWLLFVIMFAWQMPHFHAIAIHRYIRTRFTKTETIIRNRHLGFIFRKSLLENSGDRLTSPLATIDVHTNTNPRFHTLFHLIDDSASLSE
jgi:protoheme IX farnesyltransferase